MPVPSPSDVKKFLYISDYPTDKVVWRSSGSRSVSTAATMSDSTLVTIPHNLGYRPLVRGVFSENGFSDYYEIGSSPFFYNTTFMLWMPRVSAAISADTTNVYLTLINFDTTRTMSWKLIGLAPSDIPVTTNVTTPKGDGGFYFNSDYNYLKLLHDTKLSTTVSAFSTRNVSITHDLGYRPLVMVWTEFDGKTYPSASETTVGVTSIQSSFYTTDTGFTCQLVSNTGVSTSVDVHVKLYVDE